MSHAARIIAHKAAPTPPHYTHPHTRSLVTHSSAFLKNLFASSCGAYMCFAKGRVVCGKAAGALVYGGGEGGGKEKKKRAAATRRFPLRCTPMTHAREKINRMCARQNMRVFAFFRESRVLQRKSHLLFSPVRQSLHLLRSANICACADGCVSATRNFSLSLWGGEKFPRAVCVPPLIKFIAFVNLVVVREEN